MSDDAWDIFEDVSEKPNKSNDVKNYFLIDCEENKLRREFRRALKKLNIKDKSFHSCRHTRITLWAGSKFYFDPHSIRTFSGHRSDAFSRYMHLFQQMSEEVAKNKSNRKRRRQNTKRLKIA